MCKNTENVLAAHSPDGSVFTIAIMYDIVINKGIFKHLIFIYFFVFLEFYRLLHYFSVV